MKNKKHCASHSPCATPILTKKRTSRAPRTIKVEKMMKIQTKTTSLTPTPMLNEGVALCVDLTRAVEESVVHTEVVDEAVTRTKDKTMRKKVRSTLVAEVEVAVEPLAEVVVVLD